MNGKRFAVYAVAEHSISVRGQVRIHILAGQSVGEHW